MFPSLETAAAASAPATWRNACAESLPGFGEGGRRGAPVGWGRGPAKPTALRFGADPSHPTRGQGGGPSFPKPGRDAPLRWQGSAQPRGNAGPGRRWFLRLMGGSFIETLPHSALMFAALMIGHHFSISDFCSAASTAGVCWSRG